MTHDINRLSDVLKKQNNSIVNLIASMQEKLIFPTLYDSQLGKLIIQIKEYGNQLQNVFEQIPQSLLLLAKYGWYLDYDSDISLPNELKDLIQKGKIDEVNEQLTSHYRKEFNNVISSLSTRHESRSAILEQIQTAHNTKQYFLAIPCILTQIDGICTDFTKKKFFMKDDKYLPLVTKEIISIGNLTSETFLSPLLNQTPIMAHESRLNSFPVDLNRHRILHGVDVTYGSEMNSLKCISLLKYVSDILVNISK